MMLFSQKREPQKKKIKKNTKAIQECQFLPTQKKILKNYPEWIKVKNTDKHTPEHRKMELAFPSLQVIKHCEHEKIHMGMNVS